MLHFTCLHRGMKPLILVLGAVFLSSPAAWAQETESVPETPTVSLDAFPAPDSGYERHVIHLPIGNYEDNLKIELLPGKLQEVDCNPHHYTASLQEKTLEGWGYNYYELSDLAGPVSTKMACPDNTEMLKFVPVFGQGSLLQYNSNLPVVVYLPTGLELRWRTWVATPYNTASTK